MKTTTKRRIVTGAKMAAAAASVAGRKAAKRVADVADGVLVKAGNAARHRQRVRATKATLKKVGKIALVTGAAAATVVGVRAAVRRRNGH